MGVVEITAALLIRAIVLPVEWVGVRQQRATTRRLGLEQARRECGCRYCAAYLEGWL